MCKMYIKKYTNGKEIIYYLLNNKHDKIINKIGFLSFVIIPEYMILKNGKKYIKNNECHIEFILINDGYKNNGYGTYLLNKLFEYCKNNNINSITLEDCSDRCFIDRNIYINNGFKYIDKYSGEMIKYI